jgi:flagellin FlaB
MRKLMNKDEAFTGLEAAIVLIAFVVVAAVFSYVVLGAGFFTTQKSQEVVYTGVAQASSSMEILGDVYGIDDDNDNSIESIQFTVGLAAGGSSIDFNKVVITWSTESEVEIIAQNTTLINGTANPAAGVWVINDVRPTTATGDVLLENTEQYTLKVNLVGGHELEENEKFNLELKPSQGAALGLKRTGPSKIDIVNLLY